MLDTDSVLNKVQKTWSPESTADYTFSARRVLNDSEYRETANIQKAVDEVVAELRGKVAEKCEDQVVNFGGEDNLDSVVVEFVQDVTLTSSRNGSDNLIEGTVSFNVTYGEKPHVDHLGVVNAVGDSQPEGD